MGKKITLPNEFLKKIDKGINLALKECAKKIASDFKEQYRNIILDFYDDYKKPRSYNRTLETLDANILRGRDYDYKKTITILDKTSFRFNFKIGSEYIEGKPYRADTDWVFRRTYLQGIHGWTPEEVSDYTSGSNYGYYGKDGKYYMNRMMYWYDVPQPMSPPPGDVMWAWYSKYKLSYNLKNVLLPIAQESIKKFL